MGRKMRQALGAAGILAVLAGSVYALERFVRRPPLRFPYLTGPISDADYDELASKPG